MELLVQVVMAVAAAAVIIGVLTRRAASPKVLAEWAGAHSIELTDGNRAMATYWVRLLIILRVTGGTAGLLMAPVFDAASGLSTGEGWGRWVWVILGWVAGTMWADRCLMRPAAPAVAASLEPRRLADYLPAHLRAAPFAAAGLVVGLVLVALMFPAANPRSWPVPSDRLLVLTAVGAVVLVGATAGMARSVVGRRQPPSEPDVVAVDDAVRAGVLHHLAGGVTAALLLVAVEVLDAILGPRSLPFAIRGWVPLLLLLGALVAWRWSAHRAWRVRRSTRSGRAPASVP